MFLVGLFELVLGLKMFKPTLFILGTVSVLGFVMFMFYAWFLPRGSADWVVWILLVVGLGLGLVAGFFLTKVLRIGVGVAGAWAGVMLALLIHEMFLYHAKSQVVFWIIIVALGIVGFLISFWKYKFMLIFLTSFIGAYMMVRAVAMFAGGYPNEFTLIGDIKAGRDIGVGWAFWLYLAFIVVLTVTGIVVQKKIKNKSDGGSEGDYYTRV